MDAITITLIATLIPCYFFAGILIASEARDDGRSVKYRVFVTFLFPLLIYKIFLSIVSIYRNEKK